jgi:hypothetical protein
MQIDHVDKIDKTEVVEELAAEHVKTAKQTSQMEAAGKALIKLVELVEKIGLIDAELTGLIQLVTGAQAQGESVAEGEGLHEQVSSAEQTCTQKEASVEGVSGTTQSDAATDTSNESLISEIQPAEAPNQALTEDTTNTMQMEAVLEAETEDSVKQGLHADATNDESTQMVSDNTQTNIVAEAPKQVYASEDNARIEQKVGSEAPKQVSDETPSSSNLEAVPLTAEPAGLDSVEQVKGESQTVVEVSGEETYSIEQSVQMGAATEASGAQIEVERQTPEDKNIADAIMEHSVMFQETLESKVEVPVEETVDNIAAIPGQVEETAEEQTTVEEIYEKIEGKAAAEALPGESQTVVEVSGEETYSIEQSVQMGAATNASGAQIEVERQTPEDKNIADAIMEHTVMFQETESKVEVPVEESVDNIAAVPGHVEETAEEQTTVEEIYEKIEGKAAAEALPGETEGSKTADEASNEKTEDKIAVEASAGNTKEGETAAEAPELEAEIKPIVESLARENATSESTAEAPDQETRTDAETVEDIKAQHKETTTDGKTLENATIVTPVEKTATSKETVEDAAVETPDEKTL